MGHDHLSLFTGYCQVALCVWGSLGEEVWLGTQKGQNPNLSFKDAPPGVHLLFITSRQHHQTALFHNYSVGITDG